MRSKKFSAFVLAGTAAILGAAMLNATPAMALTPVSELKDVSPDHWAYNAIQTLVEKYQVMEGFPDRTFRGAKTLTRYEMAAALAKVMARVEERIAIATGQPINVDPGVNPEDLRTIARLQREFREELDALKSRVDTIDSRLMTLEKRVKISGDLQVAYRDFMGANPLASQPYADFRFRNSTMWDAQLADDLALMGVMNADIYSPQSQGNSFLRGIINTPITDIYFPKAVITYTPGWIDYAAGLGAMRDHMRLGSSMQDPFKTNVWREATGGYGFVGTPGLVVAAGGASTIANVPAVNALPGAPAWLTGTNIIEDVVDPNNSQAYGPNGNLLSAANLNLGPLKVGVGFHRGALTGRTIQSGDPNLPVSIPGFQRWDEGSMAVGTLGLDLGFARLNTVLTSPALTLGQSTVTGTGGALRDKMLGASLDLGTDALSLTGEVIGQHSWNVSDFQATKASARLGTMNLFDTGIGLGLGMVTGNINTQPALGQSAPLSGNLFSNQANYTSMGVMLRTPAIFIIPSLTIAAQNTAPNLSAAGFSGSSIASGLTIGTGFQLFGLPTLNVEYSQGKFDQGRDNTLWGTAPISAEQITVTTDVKF